MTLEDSLSLLHGKNLELTALDDALKGLAQLDAQQSRVVELRFFWRVVDSGDGSSWGAVRLTREQMVALFPDRRDL